MRKAFLSFAVIVCLTLVAPAQGQKREVDLAAPDGMKLKATYYPAAKPGPGVLLLHQCNRDRTTWDLFARRLNERGIHVVTMDYRGYGESGGERFPGLPAQERNRLINEVWPGDIDAAFDFLLKQPGVDRENIGAAGASCGVNNSLQLARRHSNVKTVALLSGTTNNEGRDYLEYAPWMPVLVAASHDDGGMVPSMRWLLGFSGNPQNKMLEYKAAGHGTDMFAVETGLEPALVDWFTQHLIRTPVKRTMGSSAKPAPLGPSAAFWKLVEGTGGAARAYEVFEQARRKDPTVMLFPEVEMNALGYGRLTGGQIEEAILLFKMNVAAYPESANVYDSLGDAYFDARKFDLAKEYAQKAIEKLATDRGLNEQGRKAIRESAERKLRAPSNDKAPNSGGAAAAPRPVAATPAAAAPAPPAAEVYRMPAVLTLPGMEAVTVQRDVVYKTVTAGAPLELKADVYIPAGATAANRYPGVILVSGGGVEAGPGADWRDAGVYVSYGRLLAASGFVGIPFSKRYQRGQEGITNGQSDLLDLIRYVREHAAELRVDPERLAVWSFSAGGMLLGVPLRDTPPYVRAIVSYYAVMDAPQSVPDDYRAFLNENTPLAMLRRNGARVAPVLVARAGLDNPGLNAGIDAFVREALAQGAEIQLLNHAQGRHGFDILDDNDRSREIIRATLEFLKARLQ
jgi:dienelactone hydrolase